MHDDNGGEIDDGGLLIVGALIIVGLVHGVTRAFRSRCARRMPRQSAARNEGGS